ncbi:FprA family A-type flavoprotein [Tissierella creatinophila]|uniref:Flavo-diiron protein FprA1 n=1 Tax=Tissierella creatinophila DSM 6911 TaxID=1123403 RepID=A0A1U7M7Z1_TISCR|nr:FprA family A-type flavoprotein [Tissierella creatinophila]OLS03432.1 flavo-diiron protein FprA1 [Tissierella creatinophila DSM 6911]
MVDDKILDVTEDVKWIGILDEGLVTFDVVMETQYGTTYNSYFIDADKKTLIETAKEDFKDIYLDKLEKVVDYSKIEYIVLNHTEPDHSSNLKHLLSLAPGATVVGSKSAISFLSHMIDIDFKQMVVKDGDTLDLGNKTLKFIGAPFLHWPDTMYTYLVEDKVLFTCDSFGSHFCDARMFDDLVDDFDDAFKYYFDVILRPFSNYMLQAIDKIKDLDIDTICPGHGPILRSNWKKYVEWSKEMAKDTEEVCKELRVFIPYVSAYGNTGKMAEKIAEGIKKVSPEIDVTVMDIELVPVEVIEKEVYRSCAFIVGSPTINQNTLLPIYTLLAVINPIRNRGKLAGAFGSYGWSGEAVKIIQDNLKNLKFKLFDEEGLKVNFVPDDKSDEKAIKYGFEFGKRLLENRK